MLQTITRPFLRFLQVTQEQTPVSGELEELRSYIDDALKDMLGYGINAEKLYALARTEKNVMVDACPGSGKSLCLLYKLFTLIKREKVDPNKILVLSFNRSIANQLKVRAHEQFGLDNMNAFFTFHSLSYRINNPRQRILCDQKNKHQYLSLYVQKIIRKYLDGVEFKYSYAQLRRLTVLAVQFLGRINKSSMNDGEIKERISTLVSHKAEALTRIGLILRECYERKKKEDNVIDFDDVIKDATKLIHITEGERYIKMSHCIGTRVKDILHILVDEWQDVGEPFYNLIQAIRQYSPDLRLFVVGDKNQACNMFMGADTKYFDRFLDMYENSTKCFLSMNYRSQKRIVNRANSSMSHAIPMRFLPHRTGGEVIEIETERNKTDVIEECARIINANPGNSITILTRTNHVLGISNNDFLESIKSQMAERLTSESIRISTIHGFKGSECEVVILLKTKGHFPLIHKDGVFFSLFANERDVVEEERRLLYVALTRSKERLYVVE